MPKRAGRKCLKFLKIKLTIPSDGQYYIVVIDEKSQSGKYSLAVGTIEDFSGSDFVTILPQAWFETKIFVNDYFAIGIFFSILASISSVIAFLAITRIRNKPQLTVKNKEL